MVVDVSNSPSFDDEPVMNFFRTSNQNLLPAEKAAGVKHHVALSVVGTDRLQASGYFRAKLVQEQLIQESKIPYTIVRATQFFEFVGAIAQGSTAGQTVRLSNVMMQPIVSDDVAAALADVALAAPLNDIIDIAGPEPIRMDDLVRKFLSANRDERKVVTDPSTRLLRHTRGRPQPHPSRRSPPRPHQIRRLAQPLPSVTVDTSI